jgi:YD repeat-containing protein
MTSPRLPQRTAEWFVAVAGLALVAAALAATQSWLDRHFLPSFLISRAAYVRIETTVRLLFAASGIALMLGARSVAARLTARWIGVAAAIALALGASELVLRNVRLRPSEWRAVNEEPRRQPDPRLGWTFVPARTGYNTNGGRTIEYTFDAGGYRVSRADRTIDPDRPSLLFAGESVMFGDSLTYEESVPAQVEAMLGTQSVNMAVYGYSTDQTYLKLERELPRFRQPEALIVLYMTALFGRNLDDDRPHLGPGRRWLPAVQHGRLMTLAHLVVPFRRESTVEHGVVVTREVLEAIVGLARSRGATPLVVVPQIGPEDASERSLRRRVFDETAIPYVMIEIDPTWHVPWDRHPDARAARTIALAIVERFRERSKVATAANPGPPGAPQATAR